MKIDNYVLVSVLCIAFMLGWIVSKKVVLNQLRNDSKTQLKSAIVDFNNHTNKYDSLSGYSIVDIESLNLTYIDVVRSHERVKIWANINIGLNE